MSINIIEFSPTEQHFDMPKIDLSGDFEMNMGAKKITYKSIKTWPLNQLEQGVMYQIRHNRINGVVTCTATTSVLVKTKHPMTGKARNLIIKRVIHIDGIL